MRISAVSFGNRNQYSEAEIEKKIKQQNPRPLVEVGDLFVARLTMLVFHGYFPRNLLSHLCGLCSSFPVACVYGDREKLVVRHLFPVFSRVFPAKIAVGLTD